MEKQAKKRKLVKVERISQEDAKKIIEKGDGEWKPLNHSTIANSKSNLRESEEFQQKQARQGSQINLCDFEEYFVNDRPILVARCTSEECRKKIAQDWFLTHCGESHRYYGKTFHRHLSRSIFGTSLRSAIPKKDKSQPSMTSYAVKVFQPAVSEEDIALIRKSMARLISSGCVPIQRFSTPEMIELVEVIVRAVSPAATDATTIENMANKITRLYQSSSQSDGQKESNVDSELEDYKNFSGGEIWHNFHARMIRENVPECQWRYKFWVANSSRFPILSSVGMILYRGSKDSTSVLERTFSRATSFLSKQRNSLLAQTIETFIKFGCCDDLLEYLKTL